jgi:hypothetical protein
MDDPRGERIRGLPKDFPNEEKKAYGGMWPDGI